MVEKKTTEAAEQETEEMVEAFYPNVPGTHFSGDFNVGINGVMYTVKRGEKVMIPKAVKEVIDYSISEDEKTAKRLAELEAGHGFKGGGSRRPRF